MAESSLTEPADALDRSDGAHHFSPIPRQRCGGSHWGMWHWPDALTGVCYLIGAFWVTLHLWGAARHRVLAGSPGDQYQFEYWLAHTARVIDGGLSPFYDNHVNAPLGINLMANTSCLGLTVPLAPVTWLWGPSVAFTVIVFIAPLSTSVAWYWFFSRQVTASTVAAAVGGGICGFAPGVISQTDGHPNVATQFVVPLILWRLIRLAQDQRYLRNGLILGLLAAYQALIDEEILLIAAMGLLVFCLTWAAFRPRAARACAWSFARGFTVAAGLALAALAYPLWFQFFGPQHYHGLGPGTYGFGTDLYAFTAYAGNSLGGSMHGLKLATSVTEQNSFFGWTLVAQVLLMVIAMWREAVVRAAALCSAVCAVLSLGTYLRVDGEYVSRWGPWRALVHLPIFDSVIPTRLTLGIVPPIALLTVLAIDRIRQHAAFRGRRDLRIVVFGGLAATLLPLLPTPLPAVARPVTPGFISSGEWRSHLASGRTLVNVPLTVDTGARTMQWAASQRLGFAIAGGYFLAPDPGAPDGPAIYGALPRPTAAVWNAIAAGAPVGNSAPNRGQVQADLRYWRAGAVILTPQAHSGALREVTTQLLGFAPTWTGGVWLWDLDHRR
jgi:hypothetical protein